MNAKDRVRYFMAQARVRHLVATRERVGGLCTEAARELDGLRRQMRWIETRVPKVERELKAS